MKYIFFAIVTFLGISVSQCRHVSSPQDNVDLDFHVIAAKTRKSESVPVFPIIPSFNKLKEVFNGLTIDKILDNDDITSLLDQRVNPAPSTEMVTFGISGHLTAGWKELKKFVFSIIDRFRGKSQASPAPAPQADSAQGADTNNGDFADSANNSSTNDASTQADTLPNEPDTNYAPFNATTNQYTPISNAQDDYQQPKPYSGDFEDNNRPLDNEIQTDVAPNEYGPYDNEPARNFESLEDAADSRTEPSNGYGPAEPARDFPYDNSQTTPSFQENVAIQDNLPDEQENNMTGNEQIPQKRNSENDLEFVTPRTQDLGMETETKSDKFPGIEPAQPYYPTVPNEEEVPQNGTDREERTPELIPEDDITAEPQEERKPEESSEDEGRIPENTTSEFTNETQSTGSQEDSVPAELSENVSQSDALEDHKEDVSDVTPEQAKSDDGRAEEIQENAIPEFTNELQVPSSQEKSLSDGVPEAESQSQSLAEDSETPFDKDARTESEEEAKPNVVPEEEAIQQNAVPESAAEPKASGAKEETSPEVTPGTKFQSQNVLDDKETSFQKEDTSVETPEETKPIVVSEEEPRIQENLRPESTTEPRATDSQEEIAPEVTLDTEFQPQDLLYDKETPLKKEDTSVETPEETKPNAAPEEEGTIQENATPEFTNEPQATGSQEETTLKVTPDAESSSEGIREQAEIPLQTENNNNYNNGKESPLLKTEPQTTGAQEEEKVPEMDLQSEQEPINNNQPPRVDENQTTAKSEQNPRSSVPETQLELEDNNVPVNAQDQVQEADEPQLNLEAKSVPNQLESENTATPERNTPVPINEEIGPETESIPIKLDENTTTPKAHSPIAAFEEPTFGQSNNQTTYPAPVTESLNEPNHQKTNAPLELRNRYQPLLSEEPKLEPPAKPTPPEPSSSAPVGKGLSEEQLRALDSNLNALEKDGGMTDGWRNVLSRLPPQIIKQLADFHNENDKVKTTANPNISTHPKVEMKYAKPAQTVPVESATVKPPRKTKAQRKAERKARQLAAGELPGPRRPFQKIQPRRITIDM